MQAPLLTRPYVEQLETWPAAGRHVLAQFDDETIVVYQAFGAGIARFAIEHQRFGGDFSYRRMSWIKPNFLWMMYRCDWGRADRQKMVLAIRLRRSFFDSLLHQTVPSSYTPVLFATPEEWGTAVAKSDVRLQWDPDHLPTGQKCERRAIQLGLRGAALEAYGQRECVEILDMTEFVADQLPRVADWQQSGLVTPAEDRYVPADPKVAAKIGLED
jgi:hypothetical protein